MDAQNSRQGGHPLTEERGLLKLRECEGKPQPPPNLSPIMTKTHSTKIKIISLSNMKIAKRCDWLTVRGRVQTKRRPKGAIVRVVLANLTKWIYLDGWGTVNRRGRFRVRAQLPVHLPLGDFRVLVHFPAQGKWDESWSESPIKDLESIQ